jgi:hypothetical protein
MERAKNLLGELVFKDKDLKWISTLKDQTADAIKTFFGTSRSKVVNKMNTSGYKRKFQSNRPQSQISTLMNSSLPRLGQNESMQMISSNALHSVNSDTNFEDYSSIPMSR